MATEEELRKFAKAVENKLAKHETIVIGIVTVSDALEGGGYLVASCGLKHHCCTREKAVTVFIQELENAQQPFKLDLTDH